MAYSILADLKRFTQVEPSDLNISDSDDPQGTGDSSWDLLLEDLQAKAKARVDGYCQRDFELHESETLELDGRGRTVLNLPNPVHSVSSVSEDGDTLTEGDQYEWKTHGSLIKTGANSPGTVRTSYREYGSGSPPGLAREKYQWEDGYNNVSVTLTYGYHPLDSGQTPAVPEDVAHAEMLLVDHTLQGMLSKRESTVVQVDEFSVTVNIPVAMNREVREILQPHKDRRGGG